MSTVNKFEMDEATGNFSVLYTDGSLGQGGLADVPVVVKDSEGNVTGLQTLSGEVVSAGGAGQNGKNAFTTLTTSFVQPAVSSNVTVSVADNSFIVTGQILFIENAGTYSVSSVSGSNTAVLTNLGYTGNVSPGSNVSSGSKLTPSGVKGDTGATGATGPQGPAGSGGGVVTSETSVTVTTTATAGDATYAVFPSQSCTELVIENVTGVEIEYQRGGAGVAIVIRPGQTKRITGITNTNQIGVRRVDYTTPVISRPTVIVGRAITSTEAFVFAGAISKDITNGGANTQLDSLACTALELMNFTGKAIMWRVGTTSAYQNLRDGESVVVQGITNANQVYMRPYDFVANLLRPVLVECFTSGLTSRLNLRSQARLVAPDARISLDDFNYPNLIGSSRTFLSVLESGDQKKTLVPKAATPLAVFPTVAGSTINPAAACVDATTGEFLYGTSAIEYTAAANNVIATFAPAAVLPVGIDVTGSDIHIEYSFPDNAGVNFSNTLSSFAVEIYSAGTPGTPGSNYHTASISSFAQGFMKVDSRRGGTIVSFSVPIENFTAAGTGATLTSILWARFRLQGNGSSTGAKFRPHSIKAIKKARNKATVVFLFDDLHIGQYTNALPLLSKYNYPACLAIDTVVKAGQTGFITPDQLVTLHQKHGWQIVGQVQGGNGASTTVDTSIAAEHAIMQAARYKAAMKALGISGTQDFSLGSSSFHSATGLSGPFFDNWPVLKRLFRTSFLFSSGNNANPPFPHGETVPFGDPYAIRRMSLSGFTAGTLAQRWKDHLDQAVATKGVAVYGAHSEFNTPGEALTAFATLIEDIRTYELAGSVEVLTVDELCKLSY